jgi:hypothetical protein
MSEPQEYYDEQTLRTVYVDTLATINPKKEYLKYTQNVMWDGGIDKYGKRYKSVWPKICNFFKSKGWNLNEIKEYIFYAVSTGITHPSTLTDVKLVEKFKKHTQTIIPEVWERIETELREFERGVKYWIRVSEYPYKKAAHIVLSDKTTVLSPQFRYFMAKILDLSDIVNFYYSTIQNTDPNVLKTYEQALVVIDSVNGSCDFHPD